MQRGGTAAMECVAQNLKAAGSYVARSLSFNDGTPKGAVTYERLTHELTDDQRVQYDQFADGWQEVLKNIDEAIGDTGGDRSARSAALSQFWGSQQRFYNQALTYFKMPSVLKSAEQDLAEGRSPVIQMFTTMDASVDHALKNRDTDTPLEDLDVSPREILMRYLETSFPIYQHEQYEDENGNIRSRMVKDSEGNPVINRRAAARRDAMLDKIGTFGMHSTPLDMILNHFGHDQVAEITGRTKRIQPVEQADGSTKKEIVSRGKPVLKAEHEAYLDGRKKVLVFSGAGATGYDYHAGKRFKNNAQRSHYLLQIGWRADELMQALGRTHRTYQDSAPMYRLCEIGEIPGERRFVSSGVRRLEQLGALTRGQREANTTGLFKRTENLESDEAVRALDVFFADLSRGNIPNLSYDEVLEQLGVKQEDDDKTGNRRRKTQTGDSPISIKQFLNRILVMRHRTQQQVFEEFDKRFGEVVAQAEKEGTLDTGMETVKAEKISKVREAEVFRDKGTGATAKLVTVSVRNKAKRIAFKDVAAQFGRSMLDREPVRYVQNQRSGYVYAAFPTVPRTDTRTGRDVKQVKLMGPNGNYSYHDESDVFAESQQYAAVPKKFETLPDEHAETLWAQQLAKQPEYDDVEMNFVSGAILPIWKRIGGDRPRIMRLRLDDGTTVIGREIPKSKLDETKKRLGVAPTSKTYPVETAHSQLSQGGKTYKLANGWKLRPVRVQGERRIQLIGPGITEMGPLERDGVRRERINYETRFFVPTGDEGLKVLERLTASRPIIEEIDED